MTVKVVKLSTGEEVIADVTVEPITQEINSYFFKLKNPARLAITNQGAALMPFSPLSSDDEFVIHSNFVIYQSNPEQEVLNAYNAQFGSGIVIANSIS